MARRWVATAALVWSASWTPPLERSWTAGLWALALWLSTLSRPLRSVRPPLRALIVSMGLWLLVNGSMPRPAPELPRVELPRRGVSGARHRLEIVGPLRRRGDTCTATARWWRTCRGHACSPRGGAVLLTLPSAGCELSGGAVLWVFGAVYPPPGFQNPGSDRTLRSWRRRGLVGRVFVADMALLSFETPAPVHTSNPAIELQERFKKRFKGPSAGLALALTLGDRSELDPRLRRSLTRTGTSHLLAVSGTHVGFLLLMVCALMRGTVYACRLAWLYRRVHRRLLEAIVGGLAIWLYCGLSGSAESTVRACVVLSAALTLRAMGSRPRATVVLPLAALIAWSHDPTAPLSLGLNLSLLGASGALIGNNYAGGGSSALSRACAVSAAAAGATACVAVEAFGGLPLVAPIANLVVVPWVGLVALPVAALAACHASLEASPDWLTRGLQGALDGAYVPFEALAGLPADTWPWLSMSTTEALLCGSLMTVATVAAADVRWRKWARALALICSLAFAVGRVQGLASSRPIRLYMLDVGHGDCLVLRDPKGWTALIDGGGVVGDDGRRGERAVVPALRALGIDAVDLMILSHAHPDHENGLLSVARHFPVRRFWFAGPHTRSPEHRALMAHLRRQQAVFVTANEIKVGPIRLRRLWPPLDSGPVTHMGLNDRSLVLELSAYGRKMLLTGDIERAAERALVARGSLTAVDLLKVPHHGSQTSSSEAFVDAVKPRLAVAGARAWGRLPFPDSVVKERYRVRHVPLWTSDRGMITVTVERDGTLTATQAASRLRLPMNHQSPHHTSQASAEVNAPGHRPGAL